MKRKTTIGFKTRQAAITRLIFFALLLADVDHPSAQVPMLAWDEDPASAVTGFAITVDGVRADYGTAPRRSDGSCGCSVPLPFTSGRHLVVISAYNTSGETPSTPLVVGPTSNAGGPFSGQAGAAMMVTAAGSTDNVGTITTYEWQWGDGASDTSTTPSPISHVYAASGTFTITLTVTDDFQASDSSTTTATISAAPQPPGTPAGAAPADGATNIATTPTLTWSANGATSYDVHFGATNPPPPVVTAQTASAYTPGALTAGTTYYWQIVALNAGGTTPGPVWSFSTAAAPPPPQPSGDVVLYAGDISAADLHGSWSAAADPTAANGIKLVTPDLGGGTTAGPLATPIDYVDVTFPANAGTPYTLWLRLRALNDNKYNDSLWVQFSDADASGQPVYPIGSTTGLLVNLATDGTATSLHGWGWQNGAYWLSQPRTVTFASTGPHTLRIQTREDGVELDQIVLSPSTYSSVPPGPPTNDSTIVPKDGRPAAPASPNPADGATGVAGTPTLRWTTSGATSYIVQFGTTNPPPQVAAAQTVSSYVPAALVAGTIYFWQITAQNSGGTSTGPIWTFTTTAASTAADIVIYASDIPTGQLHGAWAAAPDATSANGVTLATADAGCANTSAPAAAPADYVDVTFTAPAGTPYALWMRLRALNDNKYNDSIWVQFSDAQASGSPVYPIGSTSGLLVNLATDATATSLSGWGWQNGAYWLAQATTVSFASGGSHTLRIQVREDGVELDQIVLSPGTYLNTPPGPPTNDATIVPK